MTTPILVLTAKSGEYDQIDLLDSGADDFLTKPASIAVIAARLRVLIRRSADAAHRTVIDARRAALRPRHRATCRVDGAPVALTSREDQLLRRLLLANGACVTRQELLDEVWGPDSGVDASNLDIYLRRLREKLAPVRGRERARPRLPDRRAVTRTRSTASAGRVTFTVLAVTACLYSVLGTIGFVQIANGGRDGHP